MRRPRRRVPDVKRLRTLGNEKRLCAKPCRRPATAYAHRFCSVQSGARFVGLPIWSFTTLCGSMDVNVHTTGQVLQKNLLQAGWAQRVGREHSGAWTWL